MHIVMVANSAWNISNFRHPLVKAFIADGHRVTVVAPPDDSVYGLELLGCRFVALDMSVQSLNPLQDLLLMRRLKRVFIAERPDVIFSYTIKNNIFGAMAARSCGIPFVPNVTGLGTAFLSGGLIRLVAEGLYKVAFRQLPMIFFQNSDDRDLFLARKLVHAKNSRLLPGSGVDLSRFDGAEFPNTTEPTVFLMIARLLRDKGVIEFVQAARKVKALLPMTRFQLLGAIGSENRSAISETMVRNWQDEGTIEYLGTALDVRPFIAAAHCVVLPSYREGAPRTLIEAASMARPLIATDVPGCRSVVEHEITGFLCKVRDSDSLAEVCTQFLKLSRDEKVAMGVAGRAKMVREFDEQFVRDAYSDVIDHLLAN